MTIAIIGGNGQLGHELVRVFGSLGHRIVELNEPVFDITDEASVHTALLDASPHAIINTAAFTNVPKCETESATAFAVNGLGALYVARAAEKLGCPNIYISTDYVFDGSGSRPYREDDSVNPLSVYGATKYAGELFTLHYCKKGAVVRTSGLYGKHPSVGKGTNFVFAMIKQASEKPEVRVVDDEISTPTPASELAEKVADLLAAGPAGIYHLTSEGACSWYQFTQVIFDELGIKTPIIQCKVSDFPSTVKRPRYSVLENARFNALPSVTPMKPWQDSLRKFLKENCAR